jgi:hypothetical protein
MQLGAVGGGHQVGETLGVGMIVHVSRPYDARPAIRDELKSDGIVRA